ncbi:hypothetical protein CLIB1444_13S01904 [[Candida] jaroonii]|uniref:Uncharacterized protein n=1 Tax=[Candida] jaroonii TaxID=467808 RepID=A0ACA9YDL9_9ASCO|nr:hypothetical protein CLIB1444_13S01904 [[Candida] jaroonii]
MNFISVFIDISKEIFQYNEEEKIYELIKISNLTIDNLIISLYFLYKFRLNNVVNVDDFKLNFKLVIMSLVLSNKIHNDSNYTFKTWLNLCSTCNIDINLKVLKQLEVFYLNVLNYRLNYKDMYNDEYFWDMLSVNPNSQIFHQFKQADDPTADSSPIVTPIITPVDSPIVSYDQCYVASLPLSNNVMIMNNNMINMVNNMNSMNNINFSSMNNAFYDNSNSYVTNNYNSTINYAPNYYLSNNEDVY